MNFKLVCVFLCLVVSGAVADLPKELKDMLDNLHKMCQGQSGVESATIAAAKSLDLKPDPKLKCYFKCMMVSMQYMGEDGSFNGDAVVANIPEGFKALGAVDMVHKCKDVKGSDPCDKAFNLIDCFAKQAPKIAEMFV